MLSKQFKDAVFLQEQYLNEESLNIDKCILEYVFDNVADRWDTVTAIVSRHNGTEAFVLWNVDKDYICYNEEDLDPDDPDELIEDIFDCYLWDYYNNLNAAIIAVMHDCPDNDYKFRPHFNNFADMYSFYELMKKEGLVENFDEFLTDQVCEDFKQDLESVKEAITIGVPLEDLFV